MFVGNKQNLNVHSALKKPSESYEVVASSIHASNSAVPITSPPHRLSVHQSTYLFLTTLFVTCLIIADIIGVKIFQVALPFPIFGLKSIEHTCGMITFPITFLLGDIINEYYGPRATRQTVYLGLVMSILVFIVMNIAQALPYLNKPFNGKLINFFSTQLSSHLKFFHIVVTPQAFDMIFGSSKLMYVASVL
jgi:hypothetical protein